jgi:hypothetical protein
MSSIFINDGKTRTRTIFGKPGYYPEVEAVFRPALNLKREEYRTAAGSNNPAKTDECANTILAAHIVTLNGDGLPDKKAAANLEPNLKAILLDLVLGFEPRVADGQPPLVLPVETTTEGEEVKN